MCDLWSHLNIGGSCYLIYFDFSEFNYLKLIVISDLEGILHLAKCFSPEVHFLPGYFLEENVTGSGIVILFSY